MSGLFQLTPKLPPRVWEGHTWFPTSWTQPQHFANCGLAMEGMLSFLGERRSRIFHLLSMRKKEKEPEPPIMCCVRLQFQTWNVLCSLSQPPSALPASPSASPATAEHSPDFLQTLSIPTLRFSHLSTRLSYPRLLPMSLGHQSCWTGLLQSTSIHPSSFHCSWGHWNSSCPTTTPQLFLNLQVPIFCKISACLS